MSFWDRMGRAAVGGTVGFFAGGPVGAAIGAGGGFFASEIGQGVQTAFGNPMSGSMTGGLMGGLIGMAFGPMGATLDGNGGWDRATIRAGNESFSIVDQTGKVLYKQGDGGTTINVNSMESITIKGPDGKAKWAWSFDQGVHAPEPDPWATTSPTPTPARPTPPATDPWADTAPTTTLPRPTVTDPWAPDAVRDPWA